MTTLLLSGWVGSAQAASLDLLEVGGAFGTPAASNPTALWWNPAGLAVGSGHQAMIEVAPTFGKVTAQRDNPDYGDLDPAYFADGYPDSYDYGGTDTISFVGAVPFVGLSSDLTVPGLGVGLGLMVPAARGGGLEDPDGPNRFALRDGDIRAIYTTLGAAYQIREVVSIGVSGSYVQSNYVVDTDTSIYPDLAQGVADALGITEPPGAFQDGYAESPAYSVRTLLDLKDTAFTFGAGIHVTPMGDRLGISLAYNHGVRFENTGDLTLQFSCPPAYDVDGRSAAETLGICDTEAPGEAVVGYNLPSRLHLGVAVTPTERLRLELMGAAVFWSVFDDYDIQTNTTPASFPDALNVIAGAEAALLTSQDRTWARDARDTFWVGLDAKGKLSDLFTVGGRLTYDHAAIAAQSVSANNYDANTVLLSGLVDLTPVKPLSISLSWTHDFLATRTVTDSPFSLAVDPSTVAPRYFYPSANGVYTGHIDRLGITLRGRFGT